MIKCYIPIRKNETLNINGIESIKSQTADISITMISNMPGRVEKDENGYRIRDNIVDNIIDVRNQIVEKCKDDDVALLVDNDVVFTNNTVVQRMYDFLNNYEDVWAVSVVGYDKNIGDSLDPPHISMCCVMAKKIVWDSGIRFHHKEPCECSGFCSDIRRLGGRICYMSLKQELEHYDTKL